MTEIDRGKVFDLRTTALALLTTCPLALFFLLVSWVAGGSAFKDSIFGDYALTFLLLGIGAGLVCAFRSPSAAAKEEEAAIR